MDLNLENLEEWIQDDKRTINYKFLSINLGININHAKQLLFKCYEKNKDKIEATFVISGFAADTNFGDKIPKYSFVSDDLTNEISSSYFILLCSADKLEATKNKFSKIFSIHIYSLSPTRASSYDVFYSNLQTEENKKAFEDKSILNFGGIKSKAGMEIKAKKTELPIVAKKEEKSNVKPQNSEEYSGSNKEAQKNSSGFNSNNSKSRSSGNNNKDSDRIKNMFASAASKPPKPKEKPVVVVSSDEEEVVEVPKAKKDVKKSQSKSKKPTKPSNAKANNTSKKSEPEKKKRRRIKDIFSSDSEESKHSDSDNESVPDSPKRKKRHVITSESEGEVMPPTPPRVVTPKKKELPPRNKNFVMKEVTRTYTDEEGFQVTVNEWVKDKVPMETDEKDEKDEEDEVEKDEKEPSPIKIKEKKEIVKGEAEKPSNIKGTKETEKKEPERKASKVKAPPKGQPTLMSFFKKK